MFAPPRSNGWTRVIVEKPFGRDATSSAELGAGLARHLTEEQASDTFLSKGMCVCVSSFAACHVAEEQASDAPFGSPSVSRP